MKAITYFWNHPYPESILWPVVRGFDHLSRLMEQKRLSKMRYNIQCVVISLLAFALLFFLAGIGNPLEFFVDIPVYSMEEFYAQVDRNYSALLTYIILNAVAVAVVLYLIKLFLFRSEEYSFFSGSGLLFFVMSVFVSALIDIPVQEAVSSLARGPLRQMEEGGFGVSIAILILALNFAAYFVLQDTCSMIFSMYVSVGVITAFQGWFTQPIEHEFVFLLLLSALICILLEGLNRLNVWRPIVNFIDKWFYTPKYILKVTLFVGFFYIAIPLALSKRRRNTGWK